LNEPKLMIFYSILLLVVGFGIWIISSFEKRVLSKIKKDAQKKKFKLIIIRDPNSVDGKSPFPQFQIRTTKTTIFGMFNGEQTFDKIVFIKKDGKEDKYWVRVNTTSFIPSNPNWIKAN